MRAEGQLNDSQPMACDEAREGGKTQEQRTDQAKEVESSAEDDEFGWLRAGHRRGRGRGRVSTAEPRNTAAGHRSSTEAATSTRGGHPASHVSLPNVSRSTRGGRGGIAAIRETTSRGKGIQYQYDYGEDEMPQMYNPNNDPRGHQASTSNPSRPTVETTPSAPTLPLALMPAGMDDGMEEDGRCDPGLITSLDRGRNPQTSAQSPGQVPTDKEEHESLVSRVAEGLMPKEVDSINEDQSMEVSMKTEVTTRVRLMLHSDDVYELRVNLLKQVPEEYPYKDDD
ncbi:hypothetical protein J5N97_009067 [Dioscorea zingiberensis]|uniref:Uncharacterized protein n=1 Tax=Dioscorea zingiberensis TaxID=325984 RepID=A0A9D5CXI3_9LILI|nr:hypothetical protein J5N97_009067 [Dioscorea zingiberensis]